MLNRLCFPGFQWLLTVQAMNRLHNARTGPLRSTATRVSPGVKIWKPRLGQTRYPRTFAAGPVRLSDCQTQHTRIHKHLENGKGQELVESNNFISSHLLCFESAMIGQHARLGRKCSGGLSTRMMGSVDLGVLVFVLCPRHSFAWGLDRF